MSLTRAVTVISSQIIPHNDAGLLNLCLQVDALYAIVPLQFLHFQPSVPAVALPAESFSYRIKTTDGRIWNQTILFANAADTDPYMTFTVSPGWKLSEFSQQRAIRDGLVDLFKRFALSECNFDYTVV